MVLLDKGPASITAAESDTAAASAAVAAAAASTAEFQAEQREWLQQVGLDGQTIWNRISRLIIRDSISRLRPSGTDGQVKRGQAEHQRVRSRV